MPNIILILLLLFATLFIMVTLVERFGKKQSEEEVSRLSRWILPLVGLLLILQLIAYAFF